VCYIVGKLSSFLFLFLSCFLFKSQMLFYWKTVHSTQLRYVHKYAIEWLLIIVSILLTCIDRSPWDTEVCVSYYRACNMWLLARPREPCSICPAYNTHCKRLNFYSGIMDKEFTFGFHLLMHWQPLASVPPVPSSELIIE
jgi:hypothetical protein